MLRRIMLLTAGCLFLIQGMVFSEDWVPPEEQDKSVLSNELSPDVLLPLGIGAAGGLVAGAAVTAVGFYSIFSNIDNGFDNTGLQSGIVLTIGGGLLTAAASILFDFLINETDFFDDHFTSINSTRLFFQLF
ncbi:MAG: hypothetical protein JEZ04_22430 [Spirochaetales bacterium]|nr:hypothetical protein [Spirochaetales bacterium]